MSYWNAKYKNNYGEYEITFASKDYEKTKAVEKVCQAIIDKVIKSPDDVAPVVHCVDCVHFGAEACAFDAWTPYCLKHKRATFSDDFCSCGEKRKKDGE